MFDVKVDLCSDDDRALRLGSWRGLVEGIGIVVGGYETVAHFVGDDGAFRSFCDRSKDGEESDNQRREDG